MKSVRAVVSLLLAASPGFAQNVTITPIGSHPGELCANDRAIVFEDPTGVRLLYDPAHNLVAGDDPRLGDVHVVLFSHMHGDHLGDRSLRAEGAGNCTNSERVPAPNSMTAEVVVAHDAVLVTTRAMAGFVASKVEGMRGRPLGVCANPVAATVPAETACRSSMDLGGVFVAGMVDADAGVEITIVFVTCEQRPTRVTLRSAAGRPSGRRRDSRVRSAHRLCREVHQRTDRLAFGRYRYPLGDENGRQRISRGEPRRTQPG